MLSNISFQKKLFLYFGLAITVIIVFFILAFSYYSTYITRDNLNNSTGQMLQKVSDQFDAVISSMDKTSFALLIDPNIMKYVMKKIDSSTPEGAKNYTTQDSMNDLRKALDTIFTINTLNITNRMNYNIVIYNFEKRFVVTQGSMSNSEKLFDQGLENVYPLNELMNNTGKLKILTPHFNNWSYSPEPVFSVGRKIFDQDMIEIGYMEIQLSYKYLKSLWNTKNSNTYKFCILDDRREVFFPSKQIDDASYLPDTNIYKQQNFKNNSGYFIIKNSENEKEMLFYQRSKTTNFVMLLAVPINEMYSKIRTIIIIFLASGIFFLTITLAILYVLAGSLTKPLKQLRESIKHVTLDNLSINVSNTGSNNEIHLLSAAFNKMFSRLDLSIQQLNESKEREAMAKFEALQSQINPHFIYNTLSTISATAKQPNQIEKVSEMCKKLSRLLRYTTSGHSSNATIRNELDYTTNYLGLMKFRFGEQFDFDLSIPEELNEVILPKIILQPFLENCFKYAFSSQEPPWRIEIRGLITPASWTISILDNGPGFSNETLSEIKQEIQSRKERHHNFEDNGLGILNTYNRLKIFLGNQLIFSIGNAPEKGAEIIFGVYFATPEM